MDEFVKWLGQQLDADAARLGAAPPGPWSMNGAGGIVDADGGRVICSVGGAFDGRISRWPEAPVVEVVTTWHPQRLLQEIAAKRQVLRDLEQAEFTLSTTGSDGTAFDLMTGAVNSLRRVVRGFAAVYDQRPGFAEAVASLG